MTPAAATLRAAGEVAAAHPAAPVPSDLPRRAVLLSALATLGVGLLTFAAVAAHTDGYLFRGDGTGYFMMARSLVVDRDADVSDEYRQLDARLPDPESDVMMAVRYSARRLPATGRIVLPWPVGAGLVMAPFYAAGYAVELLAARVTGRAPDSFGAWPQLGYGVGALAYALLGFWASYFGCRRVAGTAAAAVSTLAVLLAGPAVFYIFFHPTMAHAASFGLSALLVLLWWPRWQAAESRLAVPGLLLGLLILVRYQNAVWGILLLALLGQEALRRRRRGLLLLRDAAAGALACAAPLGLQALHLWRSGELGLGSAAVWGPAEGGSLALAQNHFDFASPNFWRVLFSCQHGAFYWTPVLALGCAGLLWASCRSGGGWARVFLAVFLANVFVIGSLVHGTNWSGDHAYGMRYLIECAPLLAAGLAVMIEATVRAAAARPPQDQAVFERPARRPGVLQPPAPRPARVRRAVPAVFAVFAAWVGALAILAAANGLLILAFATRQIPHGGCVTYPEMASGAARELTRLAHGGCW